jgi:hypothetical protein
LLLDRFDSLSHSLKLGLVPTGIGGQITLGTGIVEGAAGRFIGSNSTSTVVEFDVDAAREFLPTYMTLFARFGPCGVSALRRVTLLAAFRRYDRLAQASQPSSPVGVVEWQYEDLLDLEQSSQQEEEEERQQSSDPAAGLRRVKKYLVDSVNAAMERRANSTLGGQARSPVPGARAEQQLDADARHHKSSAFLVKFPFKANGFIYSRQDERMLLRHKITNYSALERSWSTICEQTAAGLRKRTKSLTFSQDLCHTRQYALPP